MRMTGLGDELLGAKLVAVGRRVSKPTLVAGTSAHRAQRIEIEGKPARCFIDRQYYVKGMKAGE